MATGYASYTENVSTRGACTTVRNSQFIYHDPFGASHLFTGGTTEIIPSGSATCSSQESPTPLTAVANDGSGYTINVTGMSDVAITSATGKQVSPPVEIGTGPASVTDAHGNQISVDSSGNFTDTTGNVVLKVSGTAPSAHIFTYTDTTGASRHITVNYETLTVQTAFGCSAVTDYPATPTALVSSIELPDSSYYSFTYEQTPGVSGSVTGRLASVQLPQGGTINYTYTGSNNGIDCTDGTAAGLTRVLASDSGSAASTWTYTRTIGTGTSSTTVVDDLGNHKSYSFVIPTTSSPTAYYETSRTFKNGNSTPAVLTRSTCYNSTGGSTPCTSGSLTLPIAQIDTYETLDGVEMHGETLTYSAYGSKTGDETYDFGTSSSRGSLLRKETWSYNPLFPNLVSSDAVFDGYSNPAGLSNYFYDYTTPNPSSGIPQHITPVCPCGDLNSIALLIDSSHSYNIDQTFEDTGSLLTTTTPSGTTTLGYDPYFIYNTGVTYPTPSSGIALTVAQSYDTTYTGLPLNTTDPNSQITKVHNYDLMLRPVEDDYPDTGRTTYSYTPNSTTVNTHQTASVYGSTETLFDAYGRSSRIATTNGQSTNPYYQQDSCYDANGNLVFASYRYQSTGLSTGAGATKGCSVSSGTVSSTVNGDTYTYDVLGRLTTVTRANGETVAYTYKGRATKITDENNVQRISQIDGLGRPTIVCEISSGSGVVNSGSPSSCGTDISGTGYLTTYAYALATGTTTVTQGTQTRTFVTDWLGRTTSVTEPESGTTTYSYAYNSTGLVVTRTRPKANQTSASVTTTTTTQYDTIGRVVSVSYSDGTPTRTYAYDAPATPTSNWSDFTQTNLKGRMSLASVTGVASAFSYDPVGRVNYLDSCLPSGPCGTPGNNLLQHYTYDLAGDLLTSSDGAGVTSTYTYSPAFEIQTLKSSVNDAQDPPELISGMSNGPNGPISYNLGNGLSAAYSYDTLGRLNGGWVCTGTPTANCSGSTETYGFTNAWSGTQLQSSSDTALGQSSNYGYDQFNRLASLTVTSGTVQNYSYTYDRWGNRWNQTLTAGSGSGYQPSYHFNNANNQITLPTGYTYDAAGNMTNDGSHTYTYDAEGNITKVDSGTTAAYLYDALNHRVRTTVGTANTEFVFNQNGQRVSVWNASNNTVERDQYYWGSTPVAFANGGSVHFQHQDWLGTERTRTTYNGFVEGKYVSLPFGDGFYTASGTDQDPYHYAQLDYDSETATSHAQFRQYSSTQGRWLRPDPYYGSYLFTNPQSFNRYVYVLNNPLGYIDPSGWVLCDYGRSDNGGEDYEDDDSDQECIESGGTPASVGASVEVDGDGGGSQEVDYTDLTGTIVLDYETFAPNNGTPWYKSCTAQALGSGALSIGVDALGFIPGEKDVQAAVEIGSGTIARQIGNLNGYRGIVADQFGARYIASASQTLKAGGLGYSLASGGANGDWLSLGLNAAGLIPGLNEVAATLSIAKDVVQTGMAIAKCP